MTARGGERDVWWMLGVATLGTAAHTAFRLRFTGLRHVPSTGGALMAYNHVSVLDPIVVALGVNRTGRTVRFLSLAEAFDGPVVGRFLQKTRMIPLRRGLGDWKALEEVVQIVRGGSLAGLSPEGTVGPGWPLLPGQKGAARIALAAGAPVVPVAIWGIQDRWPKEGLHGRGPLRPTVTVAFGPPVRAEGEPRDRVAVRAMTDRIMAALGDQVDRARAAHDGS